jgi:hypothetical protein
MNQIYKKLLELLIKLIFLGFKDLFLELQKENLLLFQVNFRTMNIFSSKKIKNVYISLYFGKEDMLEKRFKKYVILFLDKDMNFQGLSKKFPCQLKESKIL